MDVVLNVKSDEDLAHIASNTGYRKMLQDLLLPYTGKKSTSAEHAGTFHSGQGGDPTHPDPHRREKWSS